MSNKQTTRTPLRMAIDKLIADGKLNSDTHLAEIMRLSKGTISTYINGKPGKNFIKEFEDRFGIKISEFEDHSNNVPNKETELYETPPDKILIQFLNNTNELIKGQNRLIEAHKDLTYSNTVLADTQKSLIEKVSSEHTLAPEQVMLRKLWAFLERDIIGKGLMSREQVTQALGSIKADAEKEVPVTDTN